jgi:hypothetical protein
MRRNVACFLSGATLAGCLALPALLSPAASASALISGASLPVPALPHVAVLQHPLNRQWWYTIQPGDTLTAIAAKVYGNARSWPALWWVNHAAVPDPDALVTGRKLRLSGWHPDAAAWLLRRAMAALPRPAPVLVPVSYATDSEPVSVAPAPSQSYTGGNALEQCIIRNESGGQTQIMNSSGHYGLFQFAYGTWVGNGGAPGDFGDASAAEQQAVYDNVAAQGQQAIYNAWESDGCPEEFGLQAKLTRPVTAAATLVSYVRKLRGWVYHAPAYWRNRLRLAALRWALAQAGKPYVWGGTGPYGFDCSGLVYAAYRAMGHLIPRDTYEMLAAAGSLLIPVSHPQRGDLAFYGSGHVELYWNSDTTFGAHAAGQPVGFIHFGGDWRPTEYFMIA